ncbi:putative late blight resistance protein homolog R1A-3 [Solanum dulcamara]|uniref:putative late blight resistance protein homolog R1A-3 n=1 Tax=Solanum dulcamara TaxID=45834 RepID=UPI002486383E|nr:putative late blight resistance protein homolog R1A-3 [Solanum dulcamara]
MDLIEKLKSGLALICANVLLSYCDLEQFEDVMTSLREVVKDLFQSILVDVDYDVRCKYNMPHVLRSLMDNIDDCLSSCPRSTSSAIMTEDQLDFLLLNLHHLSKFLAEQIYPLVTQHVILQNVCSNMKDFHGLIVNGCVEQDIVEYVLPQIQLMAERVGLFLWESLRQSGLSELDEDDQTDEDSQHITLEHLLLKIVPVELEVVHTSYKNLKSSTSAEVGRFIKQLLETFPVILREYLIHLQEHMVTVINPSISGARDIHVMMEFLLIILTDMPTDLIHNDTYFDLLARVGALTKEVSTLVWGLEEKSMKKESTNEITLKESTNETNRTTLDLLKDIELLKGDLRHVYLKSPNSSQSCFPMSDGPLFMHLLLIHLKDLLDSTAFSIALIKEEIGLVKEDLEFIRSFFANIEEGLYKDLWACVLNIAYEAKDVIDSIIVRDNGLLHLIFSLPITINKIKLIKEDISNLLEKISKNKSLIVVNSPKKPVESKSLTTGKIIVGFEEETNLIIRKLTSGPAYLDVISITGMAGSGKTTLAYKVYNDKRVSSHFDLRAWCTVDQEYDEKNLLNNIFNQVNGSDSKLRENIDVADKLRKQLYGKRYLIVLDDVWDTSKWDELTRPFPEVEKGSRIILTTREKKVALHGKRSTDPLDLRLLRPEESWELLEKRAFGNESCPDELLDVGREIVQNCKGLPLVADLIAGVIAGREKKKTVWLEVRNNLNSFIFNSEVEVMKVIELSYYHLPDHLKPCLLHFASYPKDTAVIIPVLKCVWCAEGLVEQMEMKSVEEVTKVYLDNLISSSLVISFNDLGDEPACQLHDLVHDFCLIKATKEKLFGSISPSARFSSSYLMPRMVTIDYNSQLLVFNDLVLFDSINKSHSGKHLYSLRIIGDKLDESDCDTFHLRHLRLLRVLNLDPSFINLNDSLLNEICMLNHLKFLQIGTEVKSLPLSFSNLWNLETLWVYNEESTLVLLPRIWDLVKLRVLSVTACCFFDLDADESILIEEDTKLEKLRYLGSLMLFYSKDTEDIFKRLPNLQVLSLELKESWDYSTEQFWFPKLDCLTELEELIVAFESSNINDSGPSVVTNRLWDFHFPSNLKILYLSDFPLTSDSLSTIARMPNLEVFSLYFITIQEGEWNMGEEDTFENLKFLDLSEVNLSKWEAGEESFPALEKLKLQRCCKLEEIPPSFGDICSLKIIQLVESPQLEDSTLKIKEYAEDMRGGDELQVIGRNNIPLFK